MKLARSGQRQVVLLSGEPGIGKTRLSSYAAHDAHAEGFAVAWGACTEELAVPYEPWIGVCSQLVESAPEPLLVSHVERHGGELARLVRNLRRRVSGLPEPQSSDPETERYLLFNAVAGLLGEVAEAVPLCVVLDDLHWADAQSLGLLKHLLRSTEQGALQVIVTYRDSDLGKDHPLTAVLADLRSLSGVQRIGLHGLGADEVAEIMTAVAGHELEADGIELAGQIAAETDGNPFFVGEILLGLSESGALVFDEAGGRCTPTQRSKHPTLEQPRSCMSVSSRSPNRSFRPALKATGTCACGSAYSPPPSKSTSGRTSTCSSRASFTRPTTCPCGRHAGSSVGPKRKPREVTQPQRATTPPAHSSSHASTARAPSSHARRPSSRRSPRPGPDTPPISAERALAQCVKSSSLAIAALSR